MANYQNLMAAISAVIKTNNRREITGQILQNVLNEMVGSLGENMQLTGFANPLTNPGTPDQNVFYFATQAGIYHHFDDIELDDGFSVLMWKNGQWTANTLEIAVTRQWVQNNFVSIEFFRKMFRAYDSGGAEVVPNDVQGVIDNIKAMCGMWTEQYLSALGLGSGGGGSFARYLNDLLDVTITNVQNGQALIYNSTLQQWVNGTAGVDMATVWSNLAGATSEQVNISHLTGALSGYATTESLTQQINSTKTWVTSNFITIAYFDRLFRAYNGSTLVSHNDTTSTIDNIKAMFGFWTDFYLSALGTGGVSSVSISLSQLADVNVAGVTNNQFLGYDSTNAEWVNTSLKTINGNSIIGTGDLTIAGVSTLSNLTDVALSSLYNANVLIYNSSAAKWTNSALKTINGNSLFGSGDITIGGGGSGGAYWANLQTQGSPLSNCEPTFGYLSIIRNAADTGIIIRDTTHTYEAIRFQAWEGSERGTIHYFLNFTLNGVSMGDTMNFQNISGGPITFGKWQSPLLIMLRNDNEEYGGHIDCYSNFYTYSYTAGWSPRIGSGNREWDKIGFISSNKSAGMPPGLWGHNFALNAWSEIAIGGNQIQFWLNGTTCGYWYNNDLVSYGGVTALSDIRRKKIISDAEIKVDDIARMPAILYRWNDGRNDERLHVGSIAQNWQTVLPEVVLIANDDEGTLSMQYGVAALVSSIIIARKVVSHEERIKQLEKEIEILKNENRKLTA